MIAPCRLCLGSLLTLKASQPSSGDHQLPTTHVQCPGYPTAQDDKGGSSKWLGACPSVFLNRPPFFQELLLFWEGLAVPESDPGRKWPDLLQAS